MASASNLEYAVVLAEWPQPAAGAPKPEAWADDTSLLIRYRTADDHVIIIRFPMCSHVIFGQSNDEALAGHPLYERGLTFYSVHEVRNSSLVDLLERRNSVHPSHDRAFFVRDMKHYIFTFQDSTLECVVIEGESWKPSIRMFASEKEAARHWRIAEND